jgi:hypothetical protein
VSRGTQSWLSGSSAREHQTKIAQSSPMRVA